MLIYNVLGIFNFNLKLTLSPTSRDFATLNIF